MNEELQQGLGYILKERREIYHSPEESKKQ